MTTFKCKKTKSAKMVMPNLEIGPWKYPSQVSHWDNALERINWLVIETTHRKRSLSWSSRNMREQSRSRFLMELICKNEPTNKESTRQ
jgi:hypothetical protein